MKEVIMYFDLPRFIIFMQAFIIAALNWGAFNPNNILGDVWLAIGIFTLYQFCMVLIFYTPPDKPNQKE